MQSVFYREANFSYPVAVSGEGLYLHDLSGNRYLDMSGGAAVSCLGHGHPAIVEAICQQVRNVAFAHTAFFTNEPQENLAAALSERSAEPGARVYFTSGGSEANETALKLAWQYWRALGKTDKTAIISRKFSYHGNTLGALSVSGNVERREVYESVLHDWPRISPCYAYRHQKADESLHEYGLRVAAELESEIQRLGSGNVAAFIAEPIVGASLGAVAATPGYFSAIREICDRHDVLLIADEIMCGCGRSGTYFAHEQDGILPDIVTLAKGLGAGYQPLGATLAREHIHNAVTGNPGGFAHGHTYVGHATACAAGLAVQKELDTNCLLERVADLAKPFEETLLNAVGDHPNVGDIRGRGLFWGIEFVQDRETKAPFLAEHKIPSQLKASAMQEGLICYPAGGKTQGGSGAHILLAPPFILESRHLDELSGKLKATLDRVFNDQP